MKPGSPQSPQTLAKVEIPPLQLSPAAEKKESILGAASYQVPARFGLGSIWAMLTIYSGLFAVLKWYEATPSIYFFIASLGLLVCLGQMMCGGVPRGASMWVGGIFVPLWFIGVIFFTRGVRSDVLVGMPCLVVAGAFTGYAVGTLAAGCFLAMDTFEMVLLRWRGAEVTCPVELDENPQT
jgi:hypothetical protein